MSLLFSDQVRQETTATECQGILLALPLDD
jgi:hypothetical protein